MSKKRILAAEHLDDKEEEEEEEEYDRSFVSVIFRALRPIVQLVS